MAADPEPEVADAPAEEEAAPAEQGPISVNAWVHSTFKLQSYEDPSKMNDISHDAEFDLLVGGEITDNIGVTANLVGTYGPTLDAMGNVTGDMNGSVAILDLIARIKATDAFNVWAGRMLVPSDRSNFSGVWFASPWTYPGLYVPFNAPVGPRQGPNGRNDGITLWGQAEGGMFKYYAGAFDMHDPSANPLLTGRLNLALLNPEPGYYHSSTYLGGKDILAIAIAGQYQKDGSSTATATDDYAEFNADLLYEKNLGDSGTVTVEGAFYKYMGDGEAIDYSYFGVLSYLTPENVGVGKLQPLLRLQQAKPVSGDTMTMFDVQLGYFVEAYAARFALGYQRSDVNNVDGNAIYLGVQLQK